MRGFGARCSHWAPLGLAFAVANNSVINASEAILRFRRQQDSREQQELGTDIFCWLPAIHQAVCFTCPDAYTMASYLHCFSKRKTKRWFKWSFLSAQESHGILHTDFWTSSSLCRLFYDSGYLTLAALSMENFPPSLPSYSKYHIFPCKLTLGTLIKISNRMFLMFISRNGVWKKLMLSPKAL